MFVTKSKDAIGGLCFLGMKISALIAQNISLTEDDVIKMSEDYSIINWLDAQNVIREWDVDDRKILAEELCSAANVYDSRKFVAENNGIAVLLAMIFLIIQGGGFSRTIDDIH